ncbi:MAG: diguanylate cyclase domain-containing protein [Rhodoferax sp.]
MSCLGAHPDRVNQLQCWCLMLGAALLLSLGIFVSINGVLAEPSAAVMLTLCAMVLIAIALALLRQLQLARSQRDQALARAGARECPTCEGLCQLETCLSECAARRVQALQAEIAALNSRERVLKVQAQYDGLTGLANRYLLKDRFQLAVERARRSGKSFALYMVDLNGFKAVNDQHGHAAGDEVLVVIAQRLLASVRASDTVARLGGDEFVLLVESIENPHEIQHLGEKMFDRLTAPITLSMGAVEQLGASIGLALYPDEALGLDNLLHLADQAMYECKSTGLMSLH